MRSWRMFATAALLAAVPVAAAAEAPTDFVSLVEIKPPGSAPGDRCGTVAYSYAIGRYEVSNAQYAVFLNSVAREGDPFHLYSPLMAAHFWGGIERSGEAGAYAYAPKPGYADLPATFVSWYDATRFVNWLEYGRPSTGRSELGTTEGSKRFGSYDTASKTPARNAAARFVLPNCNEWSKAAFYDPASQNFVDYPTGIAPTLSAPAGANKPDSANIMSQRGWGNPFPHLVRVDAYAGAHAPSGTQNQAGNVLEWVEDGDATIRLALGGSLFMYTPSASADYRDNERPDHKLSTLGFRIAYLPANAGSPKPGAADVAAASKPSQAATPAPTDGYVRVGEAGNEADPLYGFGAVGYDFEIARTEISNADYVAFLNAVAQTADPFRLYQPDMSSGVVGGIDRDRVGNGFSYRAKPGWEQRPVTYLSWFALARYANWNHYGKPGGGSSKLGTTEGTADQGAYDTRAFPRDPDGRFDPAALPVQRNRGARYFIPSQDEWYKAAYFDPNLHGRRYWDYATRSTLAPGTKGPNAANYQSGDALGEGSPFYVAPVDGYAESPSAFGTLQQNGNVWEWVENWRSTGEGDCWRCNEWTRGMRGGSFNYTYRGLHAENTDPGVPDQAYFGYGGRLARAVSPKGWQPPAPPAGGWGEWAKQTAKGPAARIVLAGILGMIAGAGLVLAGLWWRSRRGEKPNSLKAMIEKMKRVARSRV